MSVPNRKVYLPALKIAIDVGGTFTDVVLLGPSTQSFHYAKTPTTHHDLTEGVLKGLQEILEKAGIDDTASCHLIHGTTIGTNAIIEGKGAKIGLITTKGFEDVLEIRRVARPREATFDFWVDNPPPLVPRYLRKGIRERIDKNRRIVTPLDRSSLKDILSLFKEEKVEGIAVTLLFSFLNPEHEKAIVAIIEEELPDVHISLSSEICPEFREYERTSTTVMNAYLGPIIKAYLDKLTRKIEERHPHFNILIFQSNGGAMPVASAAAYASNLINSGPAGGAIATAFISRITGREMAIGMDMGGTTCDISVIDHGIPKTTTWGGVSEYPIKLPMIDLKTIGAGGGSIAWVDELNVLHVGPESAGSNPGPACYDWGGERPTVTDANCVLGRINPNYFLGGKYALNVEKARDAIRHYVAEKMGESVEQAALDILRIVNANMAKGISKVSVEKGYDLREFALVAFGGAAPLHTCDIADSLGIREVVIPMANGNLSAVGLAISDIQHDYVKTLMIRSDALIPSDLYKGFEELQQKGFQQLEEEKVDLSLARVEWSADMRYEGQSWELNIPIPVTSGISQEDFEAILHAFHETHRKVYSYSEPGETVEFVNLRVRVRAGSDVPFTSSAPPSNEGNRPEPKETRNIFIENRGSIPVNIYERESLPQGARVVGPAIIEEEISTTYLPTGWEISVDGYGNLLAHKTGETGKTSQTSDSGTTDKVTMQVVRYGLDSIAEDMGFNLMRMGRTTIVKEIMDLNCAVLDDKGQLLAQANLCPLMMFSLPVSASFMLKEIGSFAPGDIIISNDPYLGGQHLLDIQFFSPVFYGSELVGFVANIAHHLDLGGSVPGGVAGGLTEIYQEGLRIPFVKFFKGGKENWEISNFIAYNIRIPEKTLEDMRAQAATTLWGAERVVKLIDKYGLATFRESTRMLLDYSEAKVRKALREIPDGTFTGIDYLDDDGITPDPVKIQLNVKISGDTMEVDFKGTSPQTKGNVNSPWSCTLAGVYYTLVGIIDPYMPVNSGTFRPVKVISEKGLVTNPVPPAGVTARSQTMTKIVEAMLKAMAPVTPDRIVAGSHGQACTNSFTGIHPDTQKRFTYIEIQGGGAGARATKDGPDGQDLHLGRFMNTPVEAAELEYPVTIQRYAFIPDSGGAGRYRGGLSLRRDILFHTDVTWARYSDRQKFAPQGVFGGKEGAKGAFVLNPGTERETRGRAKGVDEIKAGDILSIRLPGSGGYGPPWERDPQIVAWDVKNGKVSRKSAREDYLVILNDDLNVDKEATARLRKSKMKSG